MTPESLAAPESQVVAVEPAPLAPIGAEERIASIDVLRGVALLGILTINIWVFALPGIDLADPCAAGGWSGPSKGAWIVCHLRAGGRMLMGMGLMQLGVFAATRSYRFYVRLALIGYGLGLPIVAYGVYDNIAHQFALVHQLIVGGHFNYVGSLFVALGHVGLVMLICKAGLLRGLTARLAAVGRMALTNYLMQTLICTTLFEGWGFGLYGRLNRSALLGVVASVWLVQLALSLLWLRQFRFGPMEWLWRSLKYWIIYPLRVAGGQTA